MKFISVEREVRMGRNGSDACPGGYRHIKDKNMCAKRAANELKKPFNKEGCFNDFGEVGCYVAWNEVFFSNCDTYTTASTHYPVCQEGKKKNKLTIFLTLNSDHGLFRNQLLNFTFLTSRFFYL